MSTFFSATNAASATNGSTGIRNPVIWPVSFYDLVRFWFRTDIGQAHKTTGTDTRHGPKVRRWPRCDKTKLESANDVYYALLPAFLLF